MSKRKIVLKIQQNKGNGQKFVNIPKNETGFLEGDYVALQVVINNES